MRLPTRGENSETMEKNEMRNKHIILIIKCLRRGKQIHKD